jgi:RNA polymerase sigma-70 factor (ECF subfamily)
MIIELYMNRDELAIGETQKKYSAFLTKITYNILGDVSDSQESVSDTYLKAWNSIPPHEPVSLAAFLGKIAREIAIDVFRKRSRQKRQASQFALSLSELDECIASSDSGGNPEQAAESSLLSEKINGWINTLAPEIRDVFVARYYFMDSIKEVAACYNMSESKVKSILHRARLGLKESLEKEGFVV